jgi:hypothetical protein
MGDYTTKVIIYIYKYELITTPENWTEKGGHLTSGCACQLLYLFNYGLI